MLHCHVVPFLNLWFLYFSWHHGEIPAGLRHVLLCDGDDPMEVLSSMYNTLRMAGVGGLARILLPPEFVLQVLAERFGREVDLDPILASTASVI